MAEPERAARGIPPQAYDELTEEHLRAGGSLKWARHGTAIGAWVAEMDFGTAPSVTQALHEAVDRARFGYLTTQAAEQMAHGGAPGEGHVRLNFATGRALLTTMVDRMAAAVRAS